MKEEGQGLGSNDTIGSVSVEKEALLNIWLESVTRLATGKSWEWRIKRRGINAKNKTKM